MPIPTYRPRSISFFLAPYRDARADLTPSPYDARTSGVRPGTPVYRAPDAGGPLTLTIHHEAAGALSSLVTSASGTPNGETASSSSTTAKKESPLHRMRIPFAAAGAVGAGLAGAALGNAMGSPTNKVRNALIGGVLGAAAGGGTAWWLATSAERQLEEDFGSPPPSSGEAGAPYVAPDLAAASKQLDLTGYESKPTLKVASMTYDPNYGSQWPGAPPPAPDAAPPKPGTGDGTGYGGFSVTGDASTTSVDAKSSDTGGSPVPWGWIVGGGLAAIVVVGGVVLAASSSKRRRRARGR